LHGHYNCGSGPVAWVLLDSISLTKTPTER